MIFDQSLPPPPNTNNMNAINSTIILNGDVAQGRVRSDAPLPSPSKNRINPMSPIQTQTSLKFKPLYIQTLNNIIFDCLLAKTPPL